VLRDLLRKEKFDRDGVTSGNDLIDKKIDVYLSRIKDMVVVDLLNHNEDGSPLE